MAFATNFDRHMKKALDKKAPEYEWEQSWSPEGEDWRVDVGGRLKVTCPLF